jgi:uncharacterized membrane protein YoaK (UPF0700 family)
MMNVEAGKCDAAVAVFLTLSGGFLYTFAYVGHGHVFANTMTGNVALLGVNLAETDWRQARRHVPPLIAFVLAIFVVHLLALAASAGHRWARQPAIACLLLEIAFLTTAASGVVPIADSWLIPSISFVATLQTLSFTHLRNLSYTSVMTTGNLRRAAQALFSGLLPKRDINSLHEARLLGMIGLSFLVGAILGGVATRTLHDSTLWLAAALLVAALVQILRVARRTSDMTDNDL